MIPFTLPTRLFAANNDDWGDDDSRCVVLHCIDCHAAGEPARVVLGGLPPCPGLTALEKRVHIMTQWDHLRQILLLEPRGYPCQNCNFIFLERRQDITEGDAETCDELQYVIGEQNFIYPLMSGHNTICVATALLECGVVPMVEPTTCFTLHAPAGPIPISAACHQGKATSIRFRNVPSFVEKLGVTVHVPHGDIGSVVCDIAYGGMWYAVVDLDQFQNHGAMKQRLRLHPDNAKELCRVGEMIKVACREQHPVQHPALDYPGVDILVFCRQHTNADGSVRYCNTVVMSNTVLEWDKSETWTAMLDRSPCGTGTCAVMAVRHAKGQLHVGEPFVHESIVGTTFTGSIVDETTITARDGTVRPAIVPQIEGTAYITQYSQVVVDPHDPFRNGFRVGDIW